jgi:signal transduction histidine kinase
MDTRLCLRHPEDERGSVVDVLGTGEVARLIAARDWASTPLGPLECWPDALVQSLRTILHSRFQLAIYWGPELVLLYNDAERIPLGALHPAALGRPAREALGEIWDVVGPMLEHVLATGEPTLSEDAPLAFQRGAAREEAFFTWSYSPIFGDSGRPEGVLLVSFETTRRVLGERRLRTLRELATRTVGQRSLDEIWRRSVDAVLLDPDVVAAGVHLVGQENVIRAASRGGGAEYPLEDAILLEAARGEHAATAEAGSVVAARIPAGLAASTPVLAVEFQPLRRVDRGVHEYTTLLASQIAATARDAAARDADRRHVQREAATEERRRIERDLHDSIQSHLVAAQLVTQLTGEAAATDVTAVPDLLEKLSDQLDAAAARVREVIAGDYPSRLAAEGLVGALRASVERSHLDVEIEGQAGRLDGPIELELFHAVAEALQNALKHAGRGAAVVVRFRRRRAALVVVVHDSGAGFDPESVRESRGIRNMAERLESVGGTCRVRSRPQHGTWVRFKCPLGRG